MCVFELAITMAPMALDEPVLQPGPKADLPPPTVYPVKEVHFEKFISPQHDGREKALAQPEGSAAIVIDNGQPPPWRLHIHESLRC